MLFPSLGFLFSSNAEEEACQEKRGAGPCSQAREKVYSVACGPVSPACCHRHHDSSLSASVCGGRLARPAKGRLLLWRPLRNLSRYLLLAAPRCAARLSGGLRARARTHVADWQAASRFVVVAACRLHFKATGVLPHIVGVRVRLGRSNCGLTLVRSGQKSLRGRSEGV